MLKYLYFLQNYVRLQDKIFPLSSALGTKYLGFPKQPPLAHGLSKVLPPPLHQASCSLVAEKEAAPPADFAEAGKGFRNQKFPVHQKLPPVEYLYFPKPHSFGAPPLPWMTRRFLQERSLALGAAPDGFLAKAGNPRTPGKLLPTSESLPQESPPDAVVSVPFLKTLGRISPNEPPVQEFYEKPKLQLLESHSFFLQYTDTKLEYMTGKEAKKQELQP